MADLYERLIARDETLAVIGLGYVGLPLAVAFARKLRVVGFDVNERKVEQYRAGRDLTGDVGDELLADCGVEFTSDPQRLAGVRCFIVTVPTPIQSGYVPDLQYVLQASRTIGRHLTEGAVVIYESTVYPGVTEELCVPALEEASGLRCGVDFGVGYSPERVNPGDKERRLETIIKIVSASDEARLDFVAALYELIIEAGVHRAEHIKVAEAAKVAENAQRDINIAFMNELSMILNQMNIDTNEVLRAAGTKWNFLPFRPGLVGGHCIGIDPYYLTFKAEDSGYRSRIVLAGRHVNESMGAYIAQNIVKQLVRQRVDMANARVAVLGLTFKENCRDIRNTKVIDIVKGLLEYGIDPLIADPYADPDEAREQYGVRLCDTGELNGLSAVVVAVAHDEFARLGVAAFDAMLQRGQTKLLFDIKGMYSKNTFERSGYSYWSL